MVSQNGVMVVITVHQFLQMFGYINWSKQPLMADLLGCHLDEQEIKTLMAPHNVTLTIREQQRHAKKKKENESREGG